MATNRDALILGGAVVALWLYQQNQDYQQKLGALAAASQPIGRLAGTVDAYAPRFFDALDMWMTK